MSREVAGEIVMVDRHTHIRSDQIQVLIRLDRHAVPGMGLEGRRVAVRIEGIPDETLSEGFDRRLFTELAESEQAKQRGGPAEDGGGVLARAEHVVAISDKLREVMRQQENRLAEEQRASYLSLSNETYCETHLIAFVDILPEYQALDNREEASQAVPPADPAEPEGSWRTRPSLLG